MTALGRLQPVTTCRYRPIEVFRFCPDKSLYNLMNLSAILLSGFGITYAY